MLSAILESLELSDVADRPARQLSGGQRRRLELARALISQVGGGIVQLSTDDNALAYDWLVGHGYFVEINEDGLCISGKNLANMVPNLVRYLPARVEKVEVREPSLEDVFLLAFAYSAVLVFDGRGGDD